MNFNNCDEITLIFDCDGTLVDSEYLCNLGLINQLQKIGIFEDANKLMKKFRGWKLSNILIDIENYYFIKLPHNFIEFYRLEVASLFDSHLQAIPYIFDALNLLNFKKCVASSAPVTKIQHALSLCGLSAFFSENIFSSYVVGSWKPEPELFIYAAKEMCSKSKNCIVIEDSNLGILAANNAGMKSIYFNPNSIQINTEFTFEITCMQQLPDAVKTLITDH
ncbi:HAD-IA family hydrolase [Brasilonema sp. CT11]|nr:HAD-IA family hydrolase [Brasilonema sp. CT11]